MKGKMVKAGEKNREPRCQEIHNDEESKRIKKDHEESQKITMYQEELRRIKKNHNVTMSR